MSLPLPPKRDGQLTENEHEFILNSTLKAKHRNEPSVLRFIEEFVRCKHIAEASAAAGIAPSLGYRYRHYKDIADCITKIIDKSAIKYGFDASEVMERTKEIIDFDPISMQNPDGTFKSKMHEIDPAARRNIKKLKVQNLYQQCEDRHGVN